MYRFYSSWTLYTTSVSHHHVLKFSTHQLTTTVQICHRGLIHAPWTSCNIISVSPWWNLNVIYAWTDSFLCSHRAGQPLFRVWSRLLRYCRQSRLVEFTVVGLHYVYGWWLHGLSVRRVVGVSWVGARVRGSDSCKMYGSPTAVNPPHTNKRTHVQASQCSKSEYST